LCPQTAQKRAQRALFTGTTLSIYLKLLGFILRPGWYIQYCDPTLPEADFDDFDI